MPPPKPTDPFPGAHVLITGAASGIGAALAASATSAGAAAVSILDVARDAGAATAASLAAQSPVPGFKAAAFTADVTDAKQVRSAVAAAVTAHGPVGVLIVNAGIGSAALFLDADPAHWARVWAVNVQGAVHTLHAALPAMAADASSARGGPARRAVVLMGSAAGFASAAGLGAYCASKAALRSMAGTLRLEMLALAPHLTVHLACPGYADTALVRSGCAGGGAASAALHAHLVPRTLPTPSSVADEVVVGVRAGLFLIPSGGAGATALAAASRDPGAPGVAWVARALGPRPYFPTSRVAAALTTAAGWAAEVGAAPILAAAALWFRGALETKTGAALATVGLVPGVVPTEANARRATTGGGGVSGDGGNGGGAPVTRARRKVQ